MVSDFDKINPDTFLIVKYLTIKILYKCVGDVGVFFDFIYLFSFRKS